MKVVLYIFGVFVAIIIVVFGAAIAYGAIYGHELDQTSLKFFAYEASATLGNFDVQASPQSVMAYTCIGSDGNSKQKPDLGQLKRFSHVNGEATLTVTIYPSQWLTAKYEGIAEFERGNGNVTAFLGREDGRWFLSKLTLHVEGSCRSAPPAQRI